MPSYAIHYIHVLVYRHHSIGTDKTSIDKHCHNEPANPVQMQYARQTFTMKVNSTPYMLRRAS